MASESTHSIIMEEEMKPCPHCQSPYGYATGDYSYSCPECAHAWTLEAEKSADTSSDEAQIIKDANGNLLQDGDDVVVIKDLPVKGMPKPVKAGTKVKNIRLVEGEHDIDCKVPGFGRMGLKSVFVRKG